MQILQIRHIKASIAVDIRLKLSFRLSQRLTVKKQILVICWDCCGRGGGFLFLYLLSSNQPTCVCARIEPLNKHN